MQMFHNIEQYLQSLDSYAKQSSLKSQASWDPNLQWDTLWIPETGLLWQTAESMKSKQKREISMCEVQYTFVYF